MATIKEEANAYQAMQTKNIADLEKVSVDLELEDRSGTDKEGKPFNYKVIVVDKQEYRIPLKVIGDLKVLLEDNPEIKSFKVIKKGQGMSTTYTVVPIFGGVSPSSISTAKKCEAYNDLYKVLQKKIASGMLTESQRDEMLEAEFMKCLI